jgi:Ssp1 endopeptidase immunity protein Rap1a
MKTIFGAIAVVALLSVSTEGKADFTGMDLLECRGAKTSCEAWIAGFEAGLFAAREGEKHNKSVCLPEGFTGKQAALIVDKYMKEHPEMLHFNAGPIVFLALWGAFPCSKS